MEAYRDKGRLSPICDQVPRDALCTCSSRVWSCMPKGRLQGGRSELTCRTLLRMSPCIHTCGLSDISLSARRLRGGIVEQTGHEHAERPRCLIVGLLLDTSAKLRRVAFQTCASEGVSTRWRSTRWGQRGGSTRGGSPRVATEDLLRAVLGGQLLEFR